MKTARVIGDLIRFRPRLFGMIVALWIVSFLIPIALGRVIGAIFDTLGGAETGFVSVWILVGMIVVCYAMRQIISVTTDLIQQFLAYSIGSLVRQNALQGIFAAPAAVALPVSAGDAISRLRDDAHAIGTFMVWWPLHLGRLVFAIVAIVTMAQISLPITAGVLAPIVAITLIVHATSAQVNRYWKAIRESSGRVVEVIAETFGAVQAIHVAGAEGGIVDHFRGLNDARKRITLRQRLFQETQTSFFQNAVNLATAAILIVAAQAIHDGRFTLGNFALFIFYLDWMTEFTLGFGTLLPRVQQASVAFNRLSELVPRLPPPALVSLGPVYLTGPLPEVPATVRLNGDRLKRIELTNMGYFYEGRGRGIEEISFGLSRGSFTVITGPIGSGKTTLLRSLLGLVPMDHGEICWNGQTVSDPASFLIPPRTAYVPQVPKLFSESLRNNILLGLPATESTLATALQVSELGPDVAAMDQGTETIVGPRGVRLSGGQIQRAATARALVREPDLFVVDDLSSALDVETEEKIWDHLFAQRDLTCLVVSHRRAAFRRADQIVILKEGRISEIGTLSDLLERSIEMQRIWKTG